MNAAQEAIGNFAMYELARNDPNAFNIFNNNLIGAHHLFSASMKSCETMQAQAARGQNPFTDWATVSMGDDWKKHMDDAANNPNDPKASDANTAKHTVDSDNGSKGVPWIGKANAGGVGQPPIQVIHDTAVAGYNTLIGGGRGDNDLSPAPKTDDDAHLVSIWPDPTAAANWIVGVVGDETVTTCNNCTKGSTPGLGLLPANEALAAKIAKKLGKLVSKEQPLNADNLAAVSAPGVMVNTAVINAMQNMPPNEQAILVGKLAQDVASARIIDEALLAKRMLETGSRVPSIYTNQAAQHNIQRAITDLVQDMNNLSFDVDMRRKVVSHTITDILQNQQAQAANIQATPSVPHNAAPVMQDGAIMQNNNPH